MFTIFLNLACLEIKNELRLFFRYPVGSISGVIVLSVLFIGVFETAQGLFASQEHDQLHVLLMAQKFVLWSTLITGFSNITSSIRDETRSGLIEIVWMARFPASFILTLRAIISIIHVIVINILIGLIISIVYGIVGFFSVQLLTGIVLVIFSSIGVGLFFGALYIIFKDIGPLIGLAQFLLLPVFFNYQVNDFSLLSVLPGLSGLEALSGAPYTIQQIGWMSLSPAGWMIIGLVTLAFSIRYSKRKGLVYEY